VDNLTQKFYRRRENFLVAIFCLNAATDFEQRNDSAQPLFVHFLKVPRPLDAKSRCRDRCSAAFKATGDFFYCKSEY